MSAHFADVLAGGEVTTLGRDHEHADRLFVTEISYGVTHDVEHRVGDGVELVVPRERERENAIGVGATDVVTPGLAHNSS